MAGRDDSLVSPPEESPAPWHQTEPEDTEPVTLFQNGDSGQPAFTALHLPSITDQKLQAAERAAYDKGFAEGRHVAIQQAGQPVQALTERLTRALADVEAMRMETLRRTERDVVRLALAMTERIIGRRLEEDRALLVEMAHTAIEQAGRPVEATVRLHPADHALLADAPFPQREGITVVADPTVPRGGCLIESTFGRIDAGVSTQVAEMSHVLLGDEPPGPPAIGHGAGESADGADG